MPHGKSTGGLAWVACLRRAGSNPAHTVDSSAFCTSPEGTSEGRFFQGTAMTYFGRCVEREDKTASRALEAPRPRSVVTSPYTAGVAELADARDSKAKNS